MWPRYHSFQMMLGQELESYTKALFDMPELSPEFGFES